MDNSSQAPCPSLEQHRPPSPIRYSTNARHRALATLTSLRLRAHEGHHSLHACCWHRQHKGQCPPVPQQQSCPICRHQVWLEGGHKAMGPAGCQGDCLPLGQTQCPQACEAEGW